MRALGGSLGPGHPLRPHMDVIESKVPVELLDRVRRHPPPDSPHADVPSEKALVRLHKQVSGQHTVLYKCSKTLFFNHIVSTLNGLPLNAVECTTIESFKNHLDKYLTKNHQLTVLP